MRNRKNNFEYFVNQKIFIWKFQLKKQEQIDSQDQKQTQSLEQYLLAQINSKSVQNNTPPRLINSKKHQRKLIKKILESQNKRLHDLSEEVLFYQTQVQIKKSVLKLYFKKQPIENELEVTDQLQNWLCAQFKKITWEQFYQILQEYLNSINKKKPTLNNHFYLMKNQLENNRQLFYQDQIDVFPVKLVMDLSQFLKYRFVYEEDLFLDIYKDYSQIYFNLYQITRDVLREQSPQKIDYIQLKQFLDHQTQNVFNQIENYRNLHHFRDILVNWQFSSAHQELEQFLSIKLNIREIQFQDNFDWDILSNDNNIFQFAEILCQDNKFDQIYITKISFQIYQQIYEFLQNRFNKIVNFFKDEHFINNQITRFFLLNLVSKSNITFALNEDLPAVKVNQEFAQNLTYNEFLEIIFRNKQYLSTYNKNLIENNIKMFTKQQYCSLNFQNNINIQKYISPYNNQIQSQNHQNLQHLNEIVRDKNEIQQYGV